MINKMNRKNLKYILVLTVALLAAATPATAQLRFGVKGGLGINSMKFNKDVLDNDNQLGWTAGVTAEVQVPVIGLAFDGAVQYTHRKSELYTDDAEGTTYKRNYIEVPIHVKYKIGMPVVGNIVAPFLFAGPDFAFLTNSTDKGNSFKDKDVALSLDLGVGVELFKKLQVSATYSAGLTKAFEYVGVNRDKYPDVKGKDKCWTIAAAYFF